MKTITLFLSLIMLALPTLAQDRDLIHKDMEMLIEAKMYNEMIEHYSRVNIEFDAVMLFNMGYALYSTGKYKEAIEYLTSAQEADPSKTTPSLMIGMAYYHLGDNKTALRYLEPAIEKEWIIEDDSDIDYYAHHSTNVAQVYYQSGQKDKAEALLNKARALMTNKSPYYSTLMFNIASIEMDKGNYAMAQPILEELVALNGKNYHAIASLIQVHHHYDDYEAADKLKAKLYRGSKRYELSKAMKDAVCIDKFEHNGKKIQVYERFQEGKALATYDKHRFVVFDEKGKVKYTIKTEYIFRDQEANDPNKVYYTVCYVTPDNDSSSFDIRLEEGYSYRDLKEVVLEILNN